MNQSQPACSFPVLLFLVFLVGLVVVIAATIKGKGVSFMENNPKFHGVAPTKDELEKALQEIGA